MDTRCPQEIDFNSVWETLIAHSNYTPSDYERAHLERAISYRPQLKPFILAHAARRLPEYGKKIASTSGTFSEDLKSVITSLVTGTFGEKAAQKLSHTYASLSSIDTSGHGGLLSEDTLIQSHAVIASGVRELGYDSFLSLACGVVPMNNSTWPRGFFILGERESIFPKSFDRVAFHECPPFTKEMIDKKLRSPDVHLRAKEILSIVSSIPAIFAQEKFHLQASLINHTLWNQHVGDGSPEFFQLMLEEVTAELVMRSIEKDDALSRLIFCNQERELLISELANLPGTWAPDKSKGTFLFWHTSGDFRAASLFPKGEMLCGHSVEIHFTPEAIREKLESREIVPSVFLSLVTLLHHGVRPLGGYHQIWYLPEYRARLARFAAEVPDVACPEFLAKISCTDLFQLGYGLAFFSDTEFPAKLSGIDTFIHTPETKGNFWNALQSTTVATAITKNVSRWYSELVPASERKKETL